MHLQFAKLVELTVPLDLRIGLSESLECTSGWRWDRRLSDSSCHAQCYTRISRRASWRKDLKHWRWSLRCLMPLVACFISELLTKFHSGPRTWPLGCSQLGISRCCLDFQLWSLLKQLKLLKMRLLVAVVGDWYFSFSVLNFNLTVKRIRFLLNFVITTE